MDPILADSGSEPPPPVSGDEYDDDILSTEEADNTVGLPAPPPPPTSIRRPVRNRAPESEQRRTQNRNAAARHRQRQHQRMEELIRRESILKQQVSELEIEIEVLRHGRAGLKLPECDPYTATILAMLEDVSNLRTSLIRYSTESQLLVNDLRRLANSLTSKRQQQQPDRPAANQQADEQ
ncbi:hypothetical protein H4S04_005212 [Coemansia sp. S16]|nr:hypothetical protein H4S03_006683 [Coemansia sp. S3946]KAJ2046148.1 hypothetical protein H4S04_005212 [Coemansia sp. S16]KAJ2066743.1 hypothetical protein GGH13_005593 [Coemansia sp. S155-1]